LAKGVIRYEASGMKTESRPIDKEMAKRLSAALNTSPNEIQHSCLKNHLDSLRFFKVPLLKQKKPAKSIVEPM
jgi:hypothetical protein